jgi:hypothetical protein
MDRTMQAGKVWNEELVWAAGTSQVFVALLSPPYVWTSEWCAMEWDLFSRRAVEPKPNKRLDNSTAIIPVLWAPTDDPLPPAIRKIQIFMPSGVPGSTESLYRRHGIFGLLRMRRRNAYGTVVWTLAQEIAATYNTRSVRRWVPAGTAGLRRSFEEDTGTDTAAAAAGDSAADTLAGETT